jgi:hypothetical protein
VKRREFIVLLGGVGSDRTTGHAQIWKPQEEEAAHALNAQNRAVCGVNPCFGAEIGRSVSHWRH